jgi:bacteriocin-like protein
MKNLKLENLGVQEMNTTEMANVNGGDALTDLLANILGLLGTIIGAVVKLVQGL